MWKINRLLKFYVKSNIIVFKIIGSTKILKVNFKQNLYDFLIYVEENIFFNDDIIKQYSIPNNLILFFEKEYCISKIEETGLELGFIHLFLKNNNLSNINDKLIKNIYSSHYFTIEEVLNKKNLLLLDYIITDLDFKIDKEDFTKPKSTRIKKTDFVKYSNLKNILSVIRFIFRKDTNNNFKSIYGSGGGLYSIFPLYISKNDKIFIYDGFNDKFYYTIKKGIFTNLSTNGFIKNTCEIEFSKYNGYILLLGNSNYVKQKYDNLGYILQLIEIGQISYLFRLLSVKFDLNYLEVQGFYHKKILSILNNLNLFSKKIDLYHIIYT